MHEWRCRILIAMSSIQPFAENCGVTSRPRPWSVKKKKKRFWLALIRGKNWNDGVHWVSLSHHVARRIRNHHRLTVGGNWDKTTSDVLLAIVLESRRRQRLGLTKMTFRRLGPAIDCALPTSDGSRQQGHIALTRTRRRLSTKSSSRQVHLLALLSDDEGAMQQRRRNLFEMLNISACRAVAVCERCVPAARLHLRALEARISPANPAAKQTSLHAYHQKTAKQYGRALGADQQIPGLRCLA